MDLNQLFYQQQRALMRAASATDAPARSRHQSSADCLSSRIALYQHALGAGMIAGTALDN